VTGFLEVAQGMLRISCNLHNLRVTASYHSEQENALLAHQLEVASALATCMDIRSCITGLAERQVP
jgi:hypothetical protein